LNPLFVLILLCFFASACGAGSKVSRGPALVPGSVSEAAFRLAETTPDSGRKGPEPDALSEENPSGAGESLLPEEAWFAFDEAPLLAFLKKAAEEGAVFAEASPAEKKPEIAEEPFLLEEPVFSSPPANIARQEDVEIFSEVVPFQAGKKPFPGATILPPKEYFFLAREPSETLDRFLEVSPSNGREDGTEPVYAVAQTFPSVLNEQVQDFISFFQGRAGNFFSRSLARSQAYEEMMKKIFREKNLPEELFYLALIESGYNPTALSRAKASGIWQFISQTAKRFGLRVDKWVDERRDPEKSTLAAAEYLKILYEMFNCWDLAAAGYNAGEGKILGAIKKARSEDFWEISKHRYLKPETKQYVPRFLAAMMIARDPQKYGFADIEYHPPLVYEKVTVPPYTSLALVARAAGADLSEIQALNPSLLRGKTPPNSPQFEVNLPAGTKEAFAKNFPALAKASAFRTTHRLRSGETLSHLARRYKVSIEDLCRVNALTPKTVLRAGALLKIPH
jgi:LysM repeat protein